MKNSSLGPLGRLIRRTLVSIVTVAIALTLGLYLVLNLIFNGPSPTARDLLVQELCQSESTKWIPGIFLDGEVIDQITAEADAGLPAALPEEG